LFKQLFEKLFWHVSCMILMYFAFHASTRAWRIDTPCPASPRIKSVSGKWHRVLQTNERTTAYFGITWTCNARARASYEATWSIRHFGTARASARNVWCTSVTMIINYTRVKNVNFEFRVIFGLLIEIIPDALIRIFMIMRR